MRGEVFHGNIVYSESADRLVERVDAYLVVMDGVVEGIYDCLPDEFSCFPIVELGKNILIPAFSDLHVHAPQYPQRGLKTDAVLYDWLHDYTFPLEAKYADFAFAKEVYDVFIDDMVAHGTLHAVIFGTIHDTTGYLVEELERKKISAYVGKVNMDVNAPAYLTENTEESLKNTERFLDRFCKNEYAKPILTPRFAPTCSKELLYGLGKLGKKYAVGVQTHLVESKWEAEEAKKLFPDCSCDTEIYEKAGLLDNGPVVGAHFIFPSSEDIRILEKYGGYAVQCPDATVNVIAGIMPSSSLAQEGINLALGTDLAAGHHFGVFTQAAKSVQLSKIKNFYEPGNEVVTFAQAFYRATKGGGALFGKVGSLEKGYAFDALVVKNLSDSAFPLRAVETVERFCHAGEKKGILARYLRGEKL